MDLRTGRLYESKAAALAAGVPESDLVAVEVGAGGRLRLLGKALGIRTSKYQPHQGKREMARRAKRMAQGQS